MKNNAFFSFIRRLRGFKYRFNFLTKNFNYGLAYENKRENISNQILLLVHAIEKGLGLKQTRLGFGIQKIYTLQQLIILWEKLSLPLDDYCYVYSMNILNFYLNYHKENHFYNDFLQTLEEFTKSRNTNNIIQTGFIKQTHREHKKDFEFLVANRHSIRDYSSRQVAKEDILYCINQARLAPSACNRQSTFVYFSMNPNIIKGIEELIPGNAGFYNVNNYLLITADITAYGDYEFMQWMTNAGIFLAYLSLSFEARGIGNCILQWANINNSEQKLRKLLNIPQNKYIVAAISIGYPSENCKLLCSTRKPLEYIYEEIK